MGKESTEFSIRALSIGFGIGSVVAIAISACLLKGFGGFDVLLRLEGSPVQQFSDPPQALPASPPAPDYPIGTAGPSNTVAAEHSHSSLNTHSADVATFNGPLYIDFVNFFKKEETDYLLQVFAPFASASISFHFVVFSDLPGSFHDRYINDFHECRWNSILQPCCEGRGIDQVRCLLVEVCMRSTKHISFLGAGRETLFAGHTIVCSRSY